MLFWINCIGYQNEKKLVNINIAIIFLQKINFLLASANQIWYLIQGKTWQAKVLTLRDEMRGKSATSVILQKLDEIACKSQNKTRCKFSIIHWTFIIARPVLASGTSVSSMLLRLFDLSLVRSQWVGACNSTIFLSWRFHSPIYF